MSDDDDVCAYAYLYTYMLGRRGGERKRNRLIYLSITFECASIRFNAVTGAIFAGFEADHASHIFLFFYPAKFCRVLKDIQVFPVK